MFADAVDLPVHYDVLLVHLQLYMCVQHIINLYSLHRRAQDVLCMRKKRQPRTSLHMSKFLRPTL